MWQVVLLLYVQSHLIKGLYFVVSMEEEPMAAPLHGSQLTSHCPAGKIPHP
jgi:hypothetical protein